MGAYKKKLIEVALPLEAINRASAHEKSIRHGHPSTLHLWWARRPLAACRAVLFASLVDDPSEDPDQFPTDAAQEAERQRLFRIIEELVKWENSTKEAVLQAARTEIMRSTGGNPPPILDPFCGGGSIPLEAQRLGLEAHASDLNPVAVFITKALIEIPPKFANLPPVNPEAQAKLGNTGWRGAQGLADDVRYYGRWLRDRAERNLGHLYPKVMLPKEHGAGEATVIAWLWARTVKCPNPACGATVPLMKSLVVCGKPKRRLWLQPEVLPDRSGIRFGVGSAEPQNAIPSITQTGITCPVCGGDAPFSYVREQASSGFMGLQAVATIVDGGGKRIYVEADPSGVPAMDLRSAAFVPETSLPKQALGFRVQNYGLLKHADLFTNRQLVLLSTFLEMLTDVRDEVEAKAATAMDAGQSLPLAEGGTGPAAYADAVATYLVLSIGRLANRNSSLCFWDPVGEKVQQVFARNALPMTWTFVEANPFSDSSGNYIGQLEYLSKALEVLPASPEGYAVQLDATADTGLRGVCVSTDPPYYDNVAYADLSDFFYVWLRLACKRLFPGLFSTLLVPKQRELIAEPSRHASRGDANRFFEEGLGKAFGQIRTAQNDAYPSTVFYAFKQSETSEIAGHTETVSTGWETMLQGLLDSGLQITATWPVRTEQAYGLRDVGRNALASSIVLACRPRREDAPLATRKEMIGALQSELPGALKRLQHGNVAPVDLAQASIGPGMAVFSRYAKVLESDGSRMSVRTALALINQALGEVVAEQEGEFDADTRWAIAWFKEVGFTAGEFGRAELLSKAKNTAVRGMVEASIVEAKGGKVRLLRREELDQEWDPATDKRLTVWEMTQHLIRRLDEGEAAAAALARRLGSNAEVARDLAYRLFIVCERKKWSQEGQAYNALVVAWPQIQRLAAAEPASANPSQTSFEV